MCMSILKNRRLEGKFETILDKSIKQNTVLCILKILHGS